MRVALRISKHLFWYRADAPVSELVLFVGGVVGVELEEGGQGMSREV